MTGTTWTTARRKELALRFMSAAFLIPFALIVVWYGGAVSAVGCAFVGAVMAYEWVRMTNSPSMKILVTLAVIPAFVALFAGTLAGGGALILCSLLAAVTHPLASERFKSGFGLFYTAGMALAVYALREEPQWDGLLATLVLMIIVWVSDSGAFFTGRTLGGPALTHISPSKTWSGAFGGVIFSVLAGFLVAHFVGGNGVYWGAAGGIISIAAQSGDMFESLMKRRLGVKDASSLLPGHGGVMDRIDGLGAAAALVLAVLLAFPGVVQALGLLR